MMMVSRLNRMHPSAESKNLENFKRECRRHKTYLLIPGTCKEDGSQMSPIIELGILKNSVLFRRAEEIGENDMDSAVLRSGEVQRPFTDFGLKQRQDTTS
jgi:hypothetical protein